MATKYTVKNYLSHSAEFVKSSCQYEAVKRKLDYHVLHKQATERALSREDEYDDQYGTSGFKKWFANQVYMAAAWCLNNPTAYRGLLSGKTTTVITEETMTGTTVVLEEKVEFVEPEDMLDEEVMKVNLVPEGGIIYGLAVDLTKPHKCCAWCNHTKYIEFFGKVSKEPDGHNKVCKACINAAYFKKGATGKPGSTRKNKSFIRTRMSIAEAKEQPQSDFVLENAELNELIGMTRVKRAEAVKAVDAAKECVEAAEKEVSRIDLMIEKLERRKR